MPYIVYNDIMEQMLVDELPVLPDAKERSFLKHSDCPKLKKQAKVKTATATYCIKEFPIVELCPRVKRDPINFDALQYWLNHLGPALYNPICVTFMPNGTRHVHADGAHRTRALWEIGFPTIRANVQYLVSNAIPGEFLSYCNKHNDNEHKPSRTHFTIDKDTKIRQYYPCIFPYPEHLKNFCSIGNDGVAVGKLISTDTSIKQIIATTPTGQFRQSMFDEIIKRVDFNGKSVLDVGCHWGWASLLAWEYGAKNVYAIDVIKSYTDTLNCIAARRVAPTEGRIHGESARLVNLIENTNDTWDIVLLFNCFHYILKNHNGAWDVLRRLLARCKTAFVMTRNLDNIYGKYNGDAEKAFSENVGQTPEHIYTWSDRKFFSLKGTL